jgi:hypothetical protein
MSEGGDFAGIAADAEHRDGTRLSFADGQAVVTRTRRGTGALAVRSSALCGKRPCRGKELGTVLIAVPDRIEMMRRAPRGERLLLAAEGICV